MLAATKERGTMGARGEIENLLYLYQELIDAGDFAGVGELFAHATMGSDIYRMTWTGATEIEAMYQAFVRIHPNGSPRTTHTTTNPIIHIDEEAGTATCRSVYVVYQQTDTLPLQPIITGRYRDRFERVDGTWRYIERIFSVSSAGDLSQHQLTGDAL
jgi:3-phenylpropionate/cinnamic acid dioxygenase small subunit